MKKTKSNYQALLQVRLEEKTKAKFCKKAKKEKKTASEKLRDLVHSFLEE